MEEKIIFQPDARIHQTPGSVGLAFDDLYVAADDGIRLNGWFVPHARAASTLLWFHGNAGNISHRVENIKLLHDNVNVNIFIFDYRGYGRSDGMASEEGTYRDGAAAIEFLRQRYGVDQSKLIIFGQSLSAAVAAEIATRVQRLAVILETPFTSVRNVARDKLPFLPIGPLLKTRYDIVEKIRKLGPPCSCSVATGMKSCRSVTASGFSTPRPNPNGSTRSPAPATTTPTSSSAIPISRPCAGISSAPSSRAVNPLARIIMGAE